MTNEVDVCFFTIKSSPSIIDALKGIFIIISGGRYLGGSLKMNLISFSPDST